MGPCILIWPLILGVPGSCAVLRCSWSIKVLSPIDGPFAKVETAVFGASKVSTETTASVRVAIAAFNVGSTPL
jgi:hypothetical protein